MKNYILLISLFFIVSCSKNEYCKYCEAKNISTGEVEETFRHCGATETDGHSVKPTWDDKYFVDTVYSIDCENYYD